MKGLRGALLGWIEERTNDLLDTPRAWGSNEAVEMQVLLLLELRALVLQPERELENPRRILDTYIAYLNRTYPKQPNRPLFQIVEEDDLGRNLGRELGRFLDALGPTLLEENPFEHNRLAIRLRFKQGCIPRTSAVTGYYEELRRAVRATARKPGTTVGRAPKDIEAATDFELADVRVTPMNGRPAEALLLLGGSDGQQNFLAEDLVRDALSGMIGLGEWAGSPAGVDDLSIDSVQRRTLLAVQTLRILPRGDVDEVAVGGQIIGRSRPVALRQSYEGRIVQAVGTTAPPTPIERHAEIRAFDRDRGQLLLGQERLRCFVRPEFLPKIVAVGESARVAGRLFSPIVGKPFVLVDEPIEGPAVTTEDADES
ncbi:MAG: hypothetical protein R3B70_28445 [Polyangiaceae bacterium]